MYTCVYTCVYLYTMCDYVWGHESVCGLCVRVVCVSVECVCGVWSLYVNMCVVYMVCGVQHACVVYVYGVR